MRARPWKTTSPSKSRAGRPALKKFVNGVNQGASRRQRHDPAWSPKSSSSSEARLEYRGARVVVSSDVGGIVRHGHHQRWHGCTQRGLSAT
eukprot:scaffold103675_cov70-Phaeocystis_antarctica.AAC.9